MKTFTVLISILISSCAFGQVRIISHISKASGGFTPGVIVGNFDNNSQNYSLTPYSQDGTAMNTVTGKLDGGGTGYFTLTELFGTENVSHFTITADSNILVSTTYESTSGKGSPAHVHETDTQALLWRVYPGEWDTIWDGFAVVNTGSSKTDITVTQKSRRGFLLNSVTAIVDLAPNAKGLFVLGSAFSKIEDSHFEISSNQPLAITSLRGSTNNTFLWENAALTPVAKSMQESSYTQIGPLNYGSVDVTSAWTELWTTSTSHHFVKAHADSKIEVFVNSGFSGGDFDSSAIAVSFEVRIGGVPGDFGSTTSIYETDSKEGLSLFSVFDQLDEGDHTISIWAKSVPSGSTSAGVMVDPGGLGGRITLKETW